MNDEFIQHICGFKGINGKAWLKSIPAVIKEYEEKWEIQALSPFNLSYNYVAPVEFSNGTPPVINIGFPGDKEFKEGVEALKFFGGRGSVKFLKEDRAKSVVLIERVVPGTPLLTVCTDDEEATIIVATV